MKLLILLALKSKQSQISFLNKRRDYIIIYCFFKKYYIKNKDMRSN